jgi:hypothetical protein
LPEVFTDETNVGKRYGERSLSRPTTTGKVEKVMLKETGSSVTNMIQRNPIPCALIGLGLGMFIVNRIRNADGRTSRSRAYQAEFEAGMPITRHAAAEIARGSHKVA